jgi:YD repeat-containing protein
MASVLPQVAGMMARISNRYDKDGLPLEVTREDGTTQRAEYDAAGRLVRAVSQASDVSFVYKDKTGQLERIEELDGRSLDIQWEGPLLRAVSWTGVVAARMELKYDSTGLPTSQTLEQGPPARL